MPQSAAELLTALEAKDLVPQEVVDNLRAQVAKAPQPISPPVLAKLLVDKGYLTALQAQKLLDNGAKAPAAKPAAKTEPQPASKPSPAKPQAAAGNGGAPKQPVVTKPTDSYDLLDDLQLVDDDAAKSSESKPAVKPAPTAAAGKGEAPSTKSAAGKPAAKPAPGKAGAAESSAAKKTTNKPDASKSAGKPAAPAALEDDLFSDMLGGSSGDLLSDDLLSAGMADGGAFDDLLGAAPQGALGGGLSASSALADPFAAPATAAATAPLPQSAAPRSGGRVRKILAVIAGSIFLIAAVVGGVLVYVNRPTGDPEFQKAEQNYGGGQWSEATAAYRAFLTSFPHHAKAGVARAHEALAQIREPIASKAEWSTVLIKATTALQAVAGEPELASAQGDLSEVLTELAEHLTEEATQGSADAGDAERIGRARAALALIEDPRYVALGERPQQKLLALHDALDVAARQAARTDRLSATVQKATEAASKGNLREAFAARRELLADYPDMAEVATLKDLGRKLAELAQPLVKTQQTKIPAKTGELPGAAVALTLAPAGATKPKRAGERPSVIVGAGSCLAVDAQTGDLRWRRDLGSRGQVIPTKTGVVLLNRQDEITSLDPQTGDVQWRWPLTATLAGPLAKSGAAIVATDQNGQIQLLSSETGASDHQAVLPQAAESAPSLDASGKYLLQLADEGLLYTLSADDLRCLKTTYIGHERGTITLPPIALTNCIVLVQQRAIGATLLRPLTLSAQGLPDALGQEISISGNVVTAPLVVDDKIVLATDENTLVSVAVGKGAKPLKLLSTTKLPADQPTAWCLTPRSGGVWCAGHGLHALKMTASGEATIAWSAHSSDSFDSPPLEAGKSVLSVAKPVTGGAARITADTPDKSDSLWQLEMPAAPLLVVSGEGPSQAVDRQGHVYALPAKLPSKSIVRATVDLKLTPGETAQHAGATGQGLTFITTSQLDKLLTLDKAGTVHALPLPGTLNGTPLAWGKGLLIPLTDGSLALIDATNGRELAEAFSRPLAPGQKTMWRLAAIDGDALLAADNKTVNRVQLQSKPTAQLVSATSADLASPIASLLAVCGGSACFVDEQHHLQMLATDTLKPVGQLDIKATAAAGPYAVGDMLLLATDQQQLLCVTTKAELRWQIALPGPLAGTPLIVDNDLIVCTTSGVLLRLKQADGQEVAREELRSTVAGPPVKYQKLLLTPTVDGRILQVAIPAPGAGKQSEVGPAPEPKSAPTKATATPDKEES